MSWWQWILACIGMYIGCAIIVGMIQAYVDGIKDSKRDEPERFSLDLEETGAAMAMWPLFTIAVWGPEMLKGIYRRGKTRANRKLIRQGKKAQDRAFKDLCKENGWNYKKMRPTPGRSLTLVG